MSESARRARNLAILSAAFLGGFVALYFAAVRTPDGQLIDAASLGVLGWLRGDAWLAFYDGRDIVLYGVLVGALVAALTVMLERRWKPVIYSGLLVGIVAVASIALKELLPRPYLGDFAYVENTFPSGHTAITLAASIAIIWCGPRWFSPVLVFLLGALVSFVALASVLSSAHRASDSLAGALLTGAVSFALAALARATLPVTSRLRRGTVIGAVIAVAIGLVYLLASLGLFGAGDHPTQLGLAVVLTTLGIVVFVIAVHRPFLPANPVRPIAPGSAGRQEGL
ncbi:phosphatase PAP2 family protein [Microbacterium sulfonylureivorans]|uniref:phosphatase PAP2 family protein n=1 Tax=Microbacterium sulfonylureivorans TaxID=2486854 RepID=UPI000FDB0E1D|nr:phosphatase PAP2 family protein [Microbacterium sulfonylureivorans]